MKGQEWYQASDVAEEYETKRFSGGGELIDRREKEAVLDALGPVEGKSILEIACGTGRFTALLAERGAEIIGLDISGPMLSQGRKKAQALGVDETLEFMRGDAGQLPFPDNHFDAVFAMRFFHLAPTPEAFISEMRRVSKEIVMFDTFNSRSTRSIYNWALPMGSHLYSRSDVEKLLQSADLQLINEEHDFLFPYGFYRKLSKNVSRPFRKLDTTLGRSGFGDRIASVSYWTAKVPE
ncbi:class I SAM-dependent methyltransferase [Salinarchaeum sp. IM2453]|uniref:class I SAM-dependent methyltransferase n=1 Tax=Salinarchaeum sp. IM2453 TaxID=2862870 RepID=UPI001C832C7B|nr:class I SAM-dependent methyltransferase [Salinarchaeum sp. IM2453]QZA88753.1 class I SAM-dependent methyltransferase [Salinarchaeum sp. IM2453]